MGSSTYIYIKRTSQARSTKPNKFFVAPINKCLRAALRYQCVCVCVCVFVCVLANTVPPSLVATSHMSVRDSGPNLCGKKRRKVRRLRGPIPRYLELERNIRAVIGRHSVCFSFFISHRRQFHA